VDKWHWSRILSEIIRFPPADHNSTTTSYHQSLYDSPARQHITTSQAQYFELSFVCSALRWTHMTQVNHEAECADIYDMCTGTTLPITR